MTHRWRGLKLPATAAEALVRVCWSNRFIHMTGTWPPTATECRQRPSWHSRIRVVRAMATGRLAGIATGNTDAELVSQNRQKSGTDTTERRTGITSRRWPTGRGRDGTYRSLVMTRYAWLHHSDMWPLTWSTMISTGCVQKYCIDSSENKQFNP